MLWDLVVQPNNVRDSQMCELATLLMYMFSSVSLMLNYACFPL